VCNATGEWAHPIDIKNVSVTLGIDGPAELTNGPLTWNLGTVYAGDCHTVSWNLHCTGEGKVHFTITPNGDGVITPDEAEPLSINVQQGPPPTEIGKLNVTLDAYKKVCTNCDGSIFYVKARVCNNLGFDLANVTGTVKLEGSGHATIQGDATLPFGDQVIYGTPTDGANLASISELRFVDLNEDSKWESGEPVYYDADSDVEVSINDTRITKADKYTFGVFPNYDGLVVSGVSEAYGIANGTTAITIVTDASDKVTAITSSDASLTLEAYNNSDVLQTVPFALTNLDSGGYIIAFGTGKHIKITFSGSTADGLANSDVIGITKGTYLEGSTVAGADSDVGITLKNDPMIKYNDTNLNTSWDTNEPVVYDLVDTSLNKYNDTSLPMVHASQ